MIVTLQHIVDCIENFATRHYYIKSFDKRAYDFDERGNVNYPLLWIQPEKMHMADGSLTFNIVLMILDRLDDPENIYQVLSDTAIAFEDFCSEFFDQDYNFTLTLPVDPTPVLDDMPEKVAGWRGVMQFTVLSSKNQAAEMIKAKS